MKSKKKVTEVQIEEKPVLAVSLPAAPAGECRKCVAWAEHDRLTGKARGYCAVNKMLTLSSDGCGKWSAK